MTRIAFFLAVTFVFGGSAGAFEVSNLERCRKIDADSARLACFDAVTADVGASEVGEEASAPSPVPSTDTGAWEVKVEVDPISDDKVLTAAVGSDGQTTGFRKPLLFVRCKNTSLEVFIVWNEFLADESSVTARIDDREPITSRWDQSTDQTASFSPQPKEILLSLIDAKRFSARITPYRSGPITASFPLDGLGTILTAHEDTCGSVKPEATAPVP